MKWLDQFTFVMRSSVTTLREKVENPERLLYQLIVDMEDELAAVRASVAAAIADEIQLGRQVERARDEVEQWQQRAAGALARNDEEASLAALDQKVQSGQRAEALAKEHEKQREQTEALRQSIRELEDKIRQARQKQSLLVARLTRADSSRRIHQALDRAEGRSAFTQFRRLEQRVERSEAMSEAYDRLDGHDPDADKLERQFQEKERKERVQAEWERLKRDVDDTE